MANLDLKTKVSVSGSGFVRLAKTDDAGWQLAWEREVSIADLMDGFAASEQIRLADKLRGELRSEDGDEVTFGQKFPYATAVYHVKEPKAAKINPNELTEEQLLALLAAKRQG